VRAKIIGRFPQYQLAIRVPQQIFREGEARWTGKTDFAFGTHEWLSIQVV
jgi:hypothetical protein